MLIVLSVSVFPLIVMCFGKKRNHVQIRRKKFRVSYIFAALPMFLVMGLRHISVGNDTGMYVNAFKLAIKANANFNVFSIFENISQEKGYYNFYQHIIAKLTDDYVIFLLISSLIIMVCILLFAYKFCDNIYLFLSLYACLGTYSFMLTALRQSMAMSICLLAIVFLRKGKLFNTLIFFLIVLFAATFHRSALIFNIVFLLSFRIVFKLKVIMYIIACSIIVFYTEYLNELVNNILGYTYSLESTENGQIFFALIILLALLVYSKPDSESRREHILINTSFVFFILWLARLFTRTAERPAVYFSFTYFVWIANNYMWLYEYPSLHKLKNFLKYVVFVLPFLLLIHRTWDFSYKFFWQ